MGPLPIFKRRFCGPSIVIVAAFLFLLSIATLLSRPAYLEHLPDVLPALEDQLPSFGDRSKFGSQTNKSGKKGYVSAKNRAWKFNPVRDANSYSLDSEQCNMAFPGLFAEIERGVDAQRARGNITPKQLNISERGRGALRGMIVDQQVRAAFAQHHDHSCTPLMMLFVALYSPGDNPGKRVRHLARSCRLTRHPQSHSDVP